MSIVLMNLKDDQTKAMNTDTSLTFDRTTDSLEAIRDEIGSSVGASISADIAAVKTAVDLISTTALVAEMNQRATAKVALADSTSVNYADVVNITDKGVFTGICCQAHGATSGNCAVTITIDGSALTELTPFPYAMPYWGSGDYQGVASLTFNHRFNTSLRIQHKSVNANVTLHTAASYTTD